MPSRSTSQPDRDRRHVEVDHTGSAPADPDLTIEHEAPTPTEYRSLRSAVGFGSVDPLAARAALEGSVWAATVRDEAGVVGLARIVGDGALCFALADVLVHPRAQGRKVGSVLMEAVMGYLRSAARPGATVTLVALPGREPFYGAFGFEECPNGTFGAGMVWPEPLAAMVAAPGG